MNKMMKKLGIGALGLWIGSMLIYFFNLDNIMIYYGVRPLMNKIYDSQKKDLHL